MKRHPVIDLDPTTRETTGGGGLAMWGFEVNGGASSVGPSSVDHSLLPQIRSYQTPQLKSFSSISFCQLEAKQNKQPDGGKQHERHSQQRVGFFGRPGSSRHSTCSGGQGLPGWWSVPAESQCCRLGGFTSHGAGCSASCGG